MRKERHQIRMAYNVTVDRGKCIGCEGCRKICTRGMFRMQNGKATLAADRECMGCESCLTVCDESAITVANTKVASSKYPPGSFPGVG